MDDASLDSAALTMHARSIPFLIDPQRQAVDWLRRSTSVQVIESGAPDLAEQIVTARAAGQEVLITGCVDLAQVLAKAFLLSPTKRGSQ